ncbi:Alpha/Beta hydrolase protein [Talaromyces proteolyticus]|uniref:Alpha/Beta hydrolase protein n=1 Tax=Talaromyces proteolyticus TaxID=1131652 RepID=A0AAD4KIK4_9EURO|nr:Alpha/Beta hydrolase protein [Talaromyces proteolyticus]KAH8689345.1 Alpha/Beta hydrolase protein [Talaromyces proteolyticus]
MPSIHWNQVHSNPLASLKILCLATLQSIPVLLQGLFVPCRLRPLGFRNALARVWLGNIFSIQGTILYSPAQDHCEQKIEGSDFEAYIIPSTNTAELQEADAIVIFAHGGGMIFGHPLQYTKTYRRWTAYAQKLGKRLVFVSVRYPLSATRKWPAQRDSMLATYLWVLQNGVSPNRVVFAGDSAGGNLATLTMLNLRDTSSSVNLPRPASAVLLSPWFDMTCAQTLSSKNVRNDMLFHFDATVSFLNDTLRPNNLPFDTPEISSLLADSVAGLPPHLVVYSSTEILASDSKRWCDRCRAANIEVTEVALEGEMHTFAVGWPICSSPVQVKCDKLICDYIIDHYTISLFQN